VVECCGRWGIPALTVFAFSVENWARGETAAGRAEVEFLLGLVHRVLMEELESLRQAGVRLQFIGQLGMLPASLRKAISHAELETADNSGLHFTIALSYGGRQDITNAVQEIARQVANGAVQPADITPELIGQHLCTSVIPPAWQQPDLIIRSSGERRLSNFMCWESAYAELHFSSVLWPDFREAEFAAALRDYATRERRFGKRM
jgi:undecaprenyl diphosphate synthase